MAKRKTKKKIEKKKKSSYDLFIIFTCGAFLISLLLLFQFLTAIGYQYTFQDWKLTINFALMKNVQVPVGTFVDGLMLFTGIYGGLEGGLSALKSMNMPVGAHSPVPKEKLQGMLFLMVIWFLLFGQSFAFTVEAQTDYNFSMDNIATGVITSILGYMWMRKSKFAEGINLSKDPNVAYQVLVPSDSSTLTQTPTVGSKIPKPDYGDTLLK